jgi:hypothetical protein
VTTTLAPDRAADPAQLRARIERRSREALIFSGATAVGLLHALDDAFVNRQPGVGIDSGDLRNRRSQVRILTGALPSTSLR